MSAEPHTVAFFLSITGAAVLMAFSGVFKSVLEWRRPKRICPSCGRHIGFRGACACR
jgi:hypothetical protein